jgi:aerobic C4-dicarboxylate transport protein
VRTTQNSIKNSLIVLGTSSSETVLPRLLEKMEALGCERQVVGMVLPTGYSFNLDGSSLYFTMALMFLAHATGTHLSVGDQISVLLVLLITSKGSAGVTGSAFIVLVGTLAATQTVPVAAAAIILGIDRFMSTIRALTNVMGNCIATLVVARWEKELDVTQARNVLSAQ